MIVQATDADGTISQVELFDNGESIGIGSPILDMPGKYLVTRANVTAGEHSLIAVTTDNGGRKAVSNAVGILVNGPAVISLDNPIENSLYSRPVNIALTATAVNQSGTVAEVEFFAGGESIGLGALSGTDQYNFTWNNAPTGKHTLRAVAKDGNGIKSYSSATQVFVTNSPTVGITSPTSGTSFARPANITLSANAKDFDGFIGKLEFFKNGVLLGTGTPPQADIYNFTWENAPAGTHSITAVATDDWGKTSTSNPISVTVTNAAPTVTMISPANGATFTATANITLTSNAADSDGTVTKVEFFKGATLLGTSNYPPFSYIWNNVAAGTYNLTAKATDDNNAAATSNPISITVSPIGDALLVVGNTTLNSVDTAIRTRLTNLGFNVVVKSATAATSADSNGKTVVVVSDTVSPANVNTKFRTVTKPVVTLDPQLFDDMGMTGTVSGTDFGTAATQKNATVTNAAHAMAAGLTGTVQVTTSTTTFAWGKPNANAVKIAALAADANKATSFGYAVGAQMPGLAAPARRVGFFYTASSASLTTNFSIWLPSAENRGQTRATFPFIFNSPAN